MCVSGLVIEIPIFGCFCKFCSKLQGRPKAPPATQNASQKSLVVGDKNKEVRGGIKFGQLVLSNYLKI